FHSSFFLFCTTFLLNLPSFPTRRSSDLLFFMFVVVGFFILLAVRYLFHVEGWRGLVSTQPFYDPKTFRWPTVLTATSFAALTYIDRKSTRLNSSHGSISYAVFCLKKNMS